MSRHRSVDVDSLLAGLKDFQRATVEYAFRRLWLDTDRTHRFLVADEVGLGKTLVAKGIIAKTVDFLQKSTDISRIDIVYICSNADIARQNIARLSVLPGERFPFVTRLTLLPTLLRDIRKSSLNFVSFTPGTSFDLGRSGGQASERVLIYRLLEPLWQFGRGAAPLNLFKGGVKDASWFRDQIRYSDSTEPVDPTISARFARRLEQHDLHLRSNGREGLRDTFEALITRLPRAGANVPRELRRERDRFIGELRRLLARTCIDVLEPDLVILDEFQRFKHLLDSTEGEENPASELAQVLFDFPQHEDLGKTRVLLLSATPYRMFTLPGELANDDHYSDFVDTLRFLHDNSDQSRDAESLLKRYKGALYRAPQDGGNELREVKTALETQLRRVMVRSERLACSPDRNGMLAEIPCDDMSLESRDALAFCEAQRLAHEIEHPDVVEYWKAAPYLLSFARDYQFSNALTSDVEGTGGAPRLVKKGEHLHVPVEMRNGDRAVDPPHPRLRWLLNDLTKRRMWDRLWLPPSLPYYASPDSASDDGVTKRLVFSSWRLVPRAIATLVSLEAERRLYGEERKAPLPEASEAVRQPLTFDLKNGQPARMNNMPLFYPSFALADLGDPLVIAAEVGRNATVDAVLAAVERRVAGALSEVLRGSATEGREDDRWYWWAPALLDLEADHLHAGYWLDRPRLAYAWHGKAAEEKNRAEEPEATEGWAGHVSALRNILRGRAKPSGRPPADLSRVLALLAVGGPAICALRALSRGLPSQDRRRVELRDAAGVVAEGMRSLFNTPEVVSMLRATGDDDEGHWRRVLRYTTDQNLQAVLDEWGHVLPEFLGIATRPKLEQASEVAKSMHEILSIRSASITTQRYSARHGQLHASDERYRSRFALRFGEHDRDEREKEVLRASHVRSAFNSPFWPFTLASTSVGQEGLDFHLYCHAVIHWNLPHNPVDLEQREGRVHRFKGHAVRKNVARTFGDRVLASGTTDPWSDMFAAASDEREVGTSEIVPYWVFPAEGGAKVERHVPALPLSSDRGRLEVLRRALVLYRMVFGQPRQEELVRYLQKTVPQEDIERLSSELRIDLSPPSLAAPRKDAATAVEVEGDAGILTIAE